ncbi:MAG: DUF499 domain-containing protein [Nanopusillaceae archaeon]
MYKIGRQIYKGIEALFKNRKKFLIVIFLVFFIFSKTVDAEVVIRSLPPEKKIREATIIDRILCYFKIKECIRGYEIYVTDVVFKEVSGVTVLGIPIEKVFVIEESKMVVDSDVKVYDYPIRIAISPGFITTYAGERIININLNPAEYIRSDYPQDIGVPRTFELTILADNVASTPIYLDKFCLYFIYERGTSSHTYMYCITLSPAVNWGPGQTLSAIFKFTNAVHLYWTIGDAIELFINDVRYLFNELCLYAGIGAISFFNNSDLYSYCNAKGFGTKCSYYGSNYAKEISYCGTTMKVYRVWFYNLDYGGLALFTTPHQIIFYGQSCPSDKVAYNGDYPSSGSNMVLTCYPCPPNSENPGVYIDRWQDGVHPYCKCKPGWKNLDESNTTITYVYDTNGCETQMTCSIDIWASPTSRTILTGQSTTYTINLKNRGNENCGYSLSYSCPSGVSCTLSQTSISINSGETKTVTLTVSSNTPGTYNLQVTASSTSPVTGFSNSTTVSLTVQQPACTVETTISPTSRTIDAGQSTTYTITVRNNGNTQCTYSISANCPYGVSCTLSSTSVTLNAGSSTSVTLTASSNTPGTYNLQVSASSTSPATGYSSTASASLTVREAYTCAVSLVSDATTKTIEVGRSTTYTITVRNNGNTQCTYSISANCPYGVSCTLSHTTVVIPQGGSANVILTASSNNPGTYNLQVSANAQAYGGSSSIGLTLIVMEAANIPDVSISPTFATIDKDQEYRFTIYVKNTGTSRTTYNLLAECSQLECTLSRNSVTVDPGQTVTEYLTVRGTKAGEFVITVRAIGPKGEEDSAIAYIIVREVQKPQPEQEQKPPQYYEEEGIAIPEIIVVPTYLELEEGGKADIFINIKNIGNAPGTFKISAVCGELYCMLSQDTIYLNVGQEANIALNIYATKVGEHTITINVINGKSVSSEVKVVVKPRGIQALFPISTENLLIVILAILIVIIIVLLLRR